MIYNNHSFECMYMNKQIKKINVEIDIKDLTFPIGIGDEIDVIALLESGIVKNLEVLE